MSSFCSPASCRCQGCGVEFPSKNAVFRHLTATQGVCLSSEPEERRAFLRLVQQKQKREKVVILYGYWIPHQRDDDDNADTDDKGVGKRKLRNGEQVAQFLLEILESLVSTPLPPQKNEENGPTAAATTTAPSSVGTSTNNSKVNRSYGHSSRGGTDILAQEDGKSAITEVLATKLPRLPKDDDGAAVQEWIQKVNAALLVEEEHQRKSSSRCGTTIRVFGRQTMSVSKFNAEKDVSHRRVEYLLPVDCLVTTLHGRDFFDDLPCFADGVVPNHHNVKAVRPSSAVLTYLTNVKKIMKSLSTQIVELDRDDAAAVLEKGFHVQKRRNNKAYQNRKNDGEEPRSEEDSEPDETNSVGKDQDGQEDKTTATYKNGKTSKNEPRRRDRRREAQAKKKRTLAKNPDKKEGVLRRKRYHNFTPTVMAHEFWALRRLDRVFHRATLRFDTNLAEHCPRTNYTNDRPFLALCLSGDMFLHGQVSRVVGLLIALVRGDIDLDFVDCVFDEQYPHLVPTPPAPSHALYAGEVFYINMEGKAKAILTPRNTDRYDKGWNDEATIRKVHDWQSTVRENVALAWLAQGVDPQTGQLVAAREWTDSVLKPWAEQARKQLAHYRLWKENMPAATNAATGLIEDNTCGTDEVADHLVQSPLSSPTIDVDATVPQAYEKVLRYLREADASGLWPSTSAKRQLVMVSNVAATDDTTNESNGTALPSSLSMARVIAKSNKKNGTNASAYAFVEGQGGASGSFSVGAMPGEGCLQPKANLLFPEVMKAAFELERVLCPDREPSSTIAVNRNAQFRPHTDSGAGAGQSTSLIVGLGTYSGGNLVVEGEQKDIRYKPIEFNGWTQRHWTMPFHGERYSLVWFTPLGCEGIRGIDLCK